MKQQWGTEEIIAYFTLAEGKDLLENKTGATLLGYAFLIGACPQLEQKVGIGK